MDKHKRQKKVKWKISSNKQRKYDKKPYCFDSEIKATSEI